MYRLAVAAMLVVPVSAMAQTSSINAFSPYSMYGIGELQTPGVVAQRSMGGVGLGMRSSVMVNPLNPAAYSLTPRQGFLFDFGVEFGQRGNDSPLRIDNRQIGLVRQRYVKFSLGLTLFGEDSWFVRYKYD